MNFDGLPSQVPLTTHSLYDTRGHPIQRGRFSETGRMDEEEWDETKQKASGVVSSEG